MIPKRAVGAIVTTAFALVLLFSFKTPGAEHLALSASGGTAIVGGSTTPGRSSTGSTSSTSGSTSRSTSGTTSGGTGTTSALRDGTYDGADIQTRYGDVQVELTVSGGAITKVTPLALPSGDGHSVRISEVVSPILRSEALTAQSAQIDLVSGATYTSTAFVESLQAALDQAKA
jgi:uncharacterized protein with FMN-binding domain